METKHQLLVTVTKRRMARTMSLGQDMEQS